MAQGPAIVNIRMPDIAALTQVTIEVQSKDGTPLASHNAGLAAAEEVADLLRRLFAPRSGLRELPAPLAHRDSSRQHRAAAGVLP